MKKINNLIILILAFGFFVSCSEKEGEIIEEELSPSAKEFNSIYTTDNTVYFEIDKTNANVLVIIPFKSRLEINSLPLTVNISSNATSNIVSGSEYDLTDPFDFEITAQDGSIVNYTITAKKCDGDKIAVIVSDTQKDIIPLYRQTQFFTNLNNVLSKASRAQVPIYYIMLSSLKGTDRWDLPTQLIYKAGTIIDKGDFVDAFDVTSFRIELLKAGIGTVYVMGVSSLGCVKGTCEGAILNKFDLFLVSDAHAEPIGYRTEESIDECNEIFERKSGTTLILADDIQF